MLYSYDVIRAVIYYRVGILLPLSLNECCCDAIEDHTGDEAEGVKSHDDAGVGISYNKGQGL